jgi:hypothetical protein
MTPLAAELNRWSAVPFRWGETDCVMLMADWAARWLGVDPAADMRLAYGTAGECQRVTQFFTDPLGTVEPRVKAAGGRPADPAPGCIGVVLQMVAPGQARPHGAVYVKDGLWAAKGETGLHIGKPLKVLGCWDIGYA